MVDYIIVPNFSPFPIPIPFPHDQKMSQEHTQWLLVLFDCTGASAIIMRFPSTEFSINGLSGGLKDLASHFKELTMQNNFFQGLLLSRP